MHMNHLLEIIAIGVASNLDNAGVGIAYGMRGIRIDRKANITIASISFIMTLFAGLLGSWLALFVPAFVARLCGATVIVAVGVYVLCQPYLVKKHERNNGSARNLLQRILRQPEKADLDQSNTISIFEALILGTALGINALAGGFDAGVTHISVWATALVIGLFSLLILGITDYVSKYATTKFDHRASILSGILLIMIGLHQI